MSSPCPVASFPSRMEVMEQEVLDDRSVEDVADGGGYSVLTMALMATAAVIMVNVAEVVTAPGEVGRY